MRAPASGSAPAHVAVIMDGNRRWAASRGLPIVEGYRRGIVALRNAVRAAIDCGVGTLTVYGFSTENWRRDEREIALLMQLCALFARNERSQLLAQGVRVEIVGDVDAFSLPARDALRRLTGATRANARLTLALALNYSGRAEIVRAAAAIAADVASGTLSPAQVDESALRARMYAPQTPDPDLLIRTGGDFRVSNFLLYQLAYTELLTVQKMWPEFTAGDFTEAVNAFALRRRNYGA